METIRRTHIKSLAHRGTIQGMTISTSSSPTSQAKDLCHYFGGVRYGLAPAERWRRAQPLPVSFTYGSEEAPGRCDEGAGLCPQPGFRHIAETPDVWNEDCFQCNVWTPVGEAPEGGWPVFVFIHGGWLQFGTPNSFNAAALIGEADFNCVVVMPAYRVNLFGFLYSAELEEDAATVGETVGNHGFWDQRLALEWTKENIQLFGGNPETITISGYSAGANSVFHQLAYDLRQPDEKSLIRQACIWSNSPAVQPKQPTETQTQFNQLLTALDIPLTLPYNEKLTLLRSIPAKTLLDKAKTIPLHQFRPTTDKFFISPSLFTTLDTGTFARSLLARNIRIIIGECCDESFLYSSWFPPTDNTLSALRTRLIADYPEHIVDAVIPLYYPDGRLPAHCKNWDQDAWGKIYADMQVHQMQRGLVYALTENEDGVDASSLLFRYRIEWRAKCVEDTLPVEWGVTHSSDYPVWFFGNGGLLGEGEKGVVKEGFIDPLGRFVRGEGEFGWGASGGRLVRTLRRDGSVDIVEDEGWDEGVRVWKVVREAGK
ncbi:Carboxylesterase, type B [Penicillium griseofulvum]|uniref:Carboxylic ester hydrolase n=1 Tax=Penicillium patulum TaxID=5078 RepID=A0A135LXS8_PENPA|nr:Carboxylesterase, type B [Penicillium griseofulvum]KXG53782.1 Carboxylesterase, type B [Penicillium griseofulvum]